MTEEHQQYFETRLREERVRAIRIVNRYAERAAAVRHGEVVVEQMPLHMADQGTDTMQHELDAALAARATTELAQIDDALRRLYQRPELFGICERTGEAIPFARMDIVPWARTRAGI
jgi:DnaK suppressor protein